MTWALFPLCRPSAESALNHQLPGRDGGTACGSRALSEGRPAGCPFPAQYGQASRRHRRLVHRVERLRYTGGLGAVGPNKRHRVYTGALLATTISPSNEACVLVTFVLY